MKLIFTFLFFLFGTLSLDAQNLGWKRQNPLPQGNSLTSVYFVGSQTGWAIGVEGTIIKTTDGGQTWKIQDTGILNTVLRSIQFIDPLNGWAAGDNGTLIKTTNGGLTWAVQSIGTFESIISFSLDAVSSKSKVAALFFSTQPVLLTFVNEPVKSVFPFFWLS